MSLSWSGPTRLLHGGEGLTTWLEDFRGHRVTLLADAAVADSAITRTVTDRLGRSRLDTDTIVLDGPGDARSIAALAGRLDGTDLVLGVGGGTLLDQAKLAALLHCAPTAADVLTGPQRSGLVVLPRWTTRSVPLVAVPTTVGTGSELSHVACLAHGDGKRLVMGGALRPDAALMDPAATATLPGELLAEGVLEALFRVVSPYVGDHRELPVEDALAETVAGLLTTLGHRVREDRLAGRQTDDRVRGDIARLSGLGHADWLNLGRPPFAVKGWLIANELSHALGIRKVTAVAALLPALWRAVLDGDDRLGSAPRLRRLWAGLRATEPGVLPADPADGIAALAAHWLIHCQVPADRDRLDAVTARIVRAWGAGLPMLGGLRADDIRRLLRDAVVSPVPSSVPPPPPSPPAPARAPAAA
ncbi:daptide-type RiPP biosynthesis dehydogenase [Streptomyces flavidovirens]